MITLKNFSYWLKISKSALSFCAFLTFNSCFFSIFAEEFVEPSPASFGIPDPSCVMIDETPGEYYPVDCAAGEYIPDVCTISKWEAPPNVIQENALQEPIADNPAVPTLKITLETGIKLALSADRRLGTAQGAVIRSDIALDLAASEFDLQYSPRGDVGMIGGGHEGTGPTFGTGIEIYKKFTYGTKVAVQPTIMLASKSFKSNVKFSITQPILRGFGQDYALSPLYGAQYSNRGARRSLYSAQINLLMQVIQAMYEIAKQEELLAVEKEAWERVKKFCTSTQMKEKIGLCDALDVYRAETEKRKAEDNVKQSEEQLQDAKDGLRDSLALPLDTPIEIEVPVDYRAMDVDVDEAIKIAMQNRIEIDQAQDQLDEARRLLRIEDRNLWPDLNLAADYTTFAGDEAFTNMWTDNSDSRWGFGFTSSGLSNDGTYEGALLNKADAERNAAQVVDDVILDVKKTIRSLQRAQEKIHLQDEQIVNARKEFHFSRLKFEHGMASNFDLIQAEKNLRSAQTSLISAIIEHKIAEFRLLVSLGTLADKPSICR